MAYQPALYDWDDLADEQEWESLIVGNGLSRAVWEDFKYESLLATASDPDLADHLGASDRKIFRQSGTANFENVLYKLKVAAEMNDLLGVGGAAEATAAYERIRKALIAAVHAVHVGWDAASEGDILDTIRDELLHYDYVISTNYDLIIYWAMMRENRASGFVDYFWNWDELSVPFLMENTDVWAEDSTRVLYLHGGLHLVKTTDGLVHKLCNRDMRSILDQFGQPLVTDAFPLVVTEGDSDAKLTSIRGSDYLAFGFERLAEITGPMVIFGHNMSESDAHIVRAIRGYYGTNRKGKPIIDRDHRGRVIAVSIWARGTDPAAEMARYQALFPESKLFFFDSETHPLGDPDLRVT